MPSNETERYRRATEDALQQLDWCIGYLHGIRKANMSARFSYHHLGRQPKGSKIRVRLRGTAANVMLLDAQHFARYGW